MADFRMELRREESTALQESITRALGLNLNDSLTLTDQWNVALSRALSDAAQVSDDVVPARLITLSEQLGVSDATITRGLGKALTASLQLTDTQEQLHTFTRTFADAVGVSEDIARVFAITVLDAIDTTDAALSPGFGKNPNENIGVTDTLIVTPDSPNMIRLYDLLPRVYRTRDTQGDLKNFLWGFQRKLGEIYRDEKGLRVIQSISGAPAWYLPYIAQSLGWQLHNKDAASRRNECASIADYYDLKGTPYGIRLLCHLTLDRLFKRLIELYTPSEVSASTITSVPNDDLQDLLDSSGDFVDPTWNDGIYHYDPLYSYVVDIKIDPDTYVYGEIRPRIEAFKERIHTMHPAGRYCYPYIHCQGKRARHYKQIQLVYEEITGLKTYDDLGYFDDGGRFDEDDAPIDQSLSTKFYKAWKTFDDEGYLDDDGFFDDGVWSVHGIFEIS